MVVDCTDVSEVAAAKIVAKRAALLVLAFLVDVGITAAVAESVGDAMLRSLENSPGPIDHYNDVSWYEIRRGEKAWKPYPPPSTADAVVFGASTAAIALPSYALLAYLRGPNRVDVAVPVAFAWSMGACMWHVCAAWHVAWLPCPIWMRAVTIAMATLTFASVIGIFMHVLARAWCRRREVHKRDDVGMDYLYVVDESDKSDDERVPHHPMRVR